jgi:hypothetical protein
LGVRWEGNYIERRDSGVTDEVDEARTKSVISYGKILTTFEGLLPQPP